MIITGKDLTIQDVVNVAYAKDLNIRISKECIENINASNRHILEMMEGTDIYYGVNTGFGSLADKHLDNKDANQLSRNIIVSHAVAVGDEMPIEWVKAAMLVRANALVKGYSGVKLETIQVILEMLNNNIVPVIPQKGSLACSGDLCFLSHLALVFSESLNDTDFADPDVYLNGIKMKSSEAFALKNLKKVRLGPKEGLAVTNGSSFTVALGCLLWEECNRLYTLGNGVLALSIEALLGARNAFDERIHLSRNHPGQIEVAKIIRNLLKGSEMLPTVGCENNSRPAKVQDSYSLRCAPQVQGVLCESLLEAKQKLEREINAATDNPLIFEDNKNFVVLSGGNFHGEIIGYTLDALKIAVSELGSISERRTFKLLDSNLNYGLPAMLTPSPGLNSGYMITQYTSASLVMENQKLAMSDTVLNVSTCMNTEDHNSNAWNAARNLYHIVENVKDILVNEYVCAVRGIQLRLLTVGCGQSPVSTVGCGQSPVSTVGCGQSPVSTVGKSLGRWTSQAYSNLSKVLGDISKDHLYKDELNSIKSIIFEDEFIQNLRLQSISPTDPENRDISKRLRTEPPKGTRDFGPKEMKIRRHVISTIRDIYETHSAVEIDTPIYEHREVLLGKYGDQQKLVFDLADQGGADYSLRYDLTVPLCRYIANNNITTLKRYHIGPVFRRDNPSVKQGRMRQFYQCDLDFVGKADLMKPDAEILIIVSRILESFKFDYTIKVNHRKLLEHIIMNEAEIPLSKFNTVCSSIDKLDKESWVNIKSELLNKDISLQSVNVLEKFVNMSGPISVICTQLKEMVKGSVQSPSFSEPLEEMKLLNLYIPSKYLQNIYFDLSLCRGLDYYTGMILEAVIKDGKDIGSIAGGGRYDDLIGKFTGRNIPAVGVSLGIERIFAWMERACNFIPTESKVIVITTSSTPEYINYAFTVCEKLWKLKINTELCPETKSLKESLGYASKNNFEYSVIIGEKELSEETVSVKNMKTNIQETFLLRNLMVNIFV